MHTLLDNNNQSISELSGGDFTHSTIAGAINALNDRIVVLDTNTKKLVWYSKAVLPIFDEGLPDWESLYQKIPEIGSLLNDTSEQKQRVSTIGVNNKLFEVILITYQKSRCVIRFLDVSEKYNERQRYLEDRERLFSTSRTISVSEMATTLAHEINQPIGTISNVLQGISMRLQKTDCDQTLLNMLNKAIEQTLFASSVIARIREYTTSHRPNFINLSITTLINESLSLLDWELSKKEVKVKRLYCNKSGSVLGDSTMLQQVLINLLRNAIDAMNGTEKSQRILVIDFSQSDLVIEITIKDNGMGLSKTVEKNLFIPFNTTKPNGMGVGLNICRSFVELHQGKLWLSLNNAQSEMAGCTAHLQLPLVAANNNE